MTPKPLTDDERHAAAKLGRGATQQAVADELGVHVKTVRRLTKREDFAALVEEADSQTFDVPPDAAPDKPTPRSVLEEMLVAVQKNGEPAKALRMQAAVALAKLPDESLDPAEPTVERVVLTGEEPFDRGVAAILNAKPANESVYIVIAARDAGDQAAAAHIIGPTDGPWRPSRPEEPAPLGDQPTPDQPPSGRGE